MITPNVILHQYDPKWLLPQSKLVCSLAHAAHADGAHPCAEMRLSLSCECDEGS